MSHLNETQKIYRKMALLFCCTSVITALWIALIFSFSSTVGEKSASQSQTVTESVVRVVKPDYTMPEKVEPKSIDSLYDTIVRKIAHTCVYSVLGVLMYLTVRTLTLAGNTYWGAKLSVPLCMLVSIGDEYNQTLTEGRSGRLYDVAIDTAGVIIGTYLCVVLIKYVLKRRQNHAG